MGLRVVSLENGQVQELVTSAASPEALHGEVVLRWSPQGDRLAYVSASPTLASGVEVLTVEVTTGRQQSITGPLQCRASLLDWSADGRWLAVAVDGLCL
jgi:Tol biopolymer transport system component